MHSKMLRHAGLVLCTAVCFCAASPGAHASLTPEQRKALAHSFVDKLKNFYKKAKTQEEKFDSEHLSTIPDGQDLLLQPYFKGTLFSDNVYGIKHNEKVFLSFQSFIDVMYFSIKYDEDTHDAQGWFLREDWPFEMDYKARTVTTKGKTYSITDSNSYIKNDELFISSDALEVWFGISIKPDLTAQTILLDSDYPFPIQAHKKRFDRGEPEQQDSNVAQFPLRETPYKWLDVDSAQVSATTSRRSNPEKPSENRSEGNIVTQGQLLKHSFYATLSADGQNKISSINGDLFKESLEPELLGPLKARAYYIGDIQQNSIPLVPMGESGIGASVTNLPLNERYDLSTTAIRGHATPGWDVELYRNDGLVDTMTVGDDGRYDFENVELFSGDNDFEVLFYGPQGEVRRETVSLPVDQNVISQKDGTYEISAILQNDNLYSKLETQDVDNNTLNLSGRYNYLIGNVLNYIGFRNVSIDGEQKQYLATGITTTAMSTLIDAGIAVDNKGAAKTAVQLRRGIGDADISLNAALATDNFVTSALEDPVVLEVGGSVRKPLHFLPGRRNNLFITLDHAETSTGETQDVNNIALASQYGGLSVTNALEDRTVDDENQQDYSPSVSGRLGKFFWRANANYEIAPTKGLNDVLLDVRYNHNERWSGDFTVQRQPERNFTEYQLGATWNNSKFILTPFINYDTDKELYTGVNVSFGLVNPPGDDPLIMTNRNISGQGFVSAFVYLDKNGDLRFDNDDEPLQDVIVKSVNVARKEKTNNKGLALLNSLPANRQTDINLDPNTLPDPFMISKYQPRSVAVKPGEIVNLEMPIQYAGEIDGTLWLSRHEGTLKNPMRGRVSLLPLENDQNVSMQSEALSDGFFIFSLIPAGRYYLVVNPLDAGDKNAYRPAPRLITIGYDGPVLYGQDVMLTQGQKDIDFNVLTEEQALNLGFAPVSDRRNAKPYYLISIEKEKGSKLLNILYRFNAKKLASQYLADLQTLETKGDDKYLLRYFAPDQSLEKAYDRCNLIASRGLPCTVEAVVPPSESFAVRQKGIITTDNEKETPSGG